MKTARRFGIYFVGMVVLALVISLNTKTQWGVSPIISVAYSISDIFTLNFANTCMAMYVVIFIIEELIKWKSFRFYDILQLPFCFLFTRALGFFTDYLPNAETIPMKIVVLLLAILLTGLGVVLMLKMRIVPNPADGLVQAANDRFGLSMGTWKNILDAFCILVSAGISLIGAGKLVGIGIGTVVTVLLTGRAVALHTFLFGKPLQAVYERAVAEREEKKKKKQAARETEAASETAGADTVPKEEERPALREAASEDGDRTCPQENHAAFFQNKACPCFPCHATEDPDDFNCLFCYCPLYALGDQCKGNFTYTEKGYKDCSACMIPHKRENYDLIMERSKELCERVRKK